MVVCKWKVLAQPSLAAGSILRPLLEITSEGYKSYQSLLGPACADRRHMAFLSRVVRRRDTSFFDGSDRR
jgi:hypothetical protein